MSAMQEISRYDVLLSQFPFKKIPVHSVDYDSLKRMFDFLYEYTDIYQLAFIRGEAMFQYLKYHQTMQFEIISFAQAIQDIKIFTFYLKNDRTINNDLRLDFSLQNYHLWESL